MANIKLEAGFVQRISANTSLASANFLLEHGLKTPDPRKLEQDLE
jgi:hypothetical protein